MTEVITSEKLETLLDRLRRMTAEPGWLTFYMRKDEAQLILDTIEARPSPITGEEVREAIRAVHAAMLYGGDGAEGDYGWSITALNKARPAIRAAAATLNIGKGQA